MIKELLPTEALTTTLCYPWFELKDELNSIFIEHRHTTRSTIRVCSIILSVCIGLFIFFNNPSVAEFFRGIIEALSFIPEPLQYKASVSLATLAASSTGAYTSRAITRCICKCKFGDPDFFLTDQRTLELIEIFKAQELDIDADLLKEVVQFCVHKLREPHASATIGARKQDWEHILNSIIYEADLDIFLEQQRALHYSHKLILDKKAAINIYKQLTQNENTANQLPTSSPTQPPTIRLTALELGTQQPTEQTPLLQQSFNNTTRHSISSGSSGSSRDVSLARRTLNQFRQTRQNQISFSTVQSEEQIADQCSQHLENRALSTHQHLLYSHGIHNMIRRTIPPASPNSFTPAYPSFPNDEELDQSSIPSPTHRNRSLSGATDPNRNRSSSNATEPPVTPLRGLSRVTICSRPTG